MFSKHSSEVDLSNRPHTLGPTERQMAGAGDKNNGNSPGRFLKRISIRFWHFSLYYGTGLSASPANVRFSPGQRSR
ncbi:MAG: hypothetical protein ACP5D7_25780 [Limnospira sp.]